MMSKIGMASIYKFKNGKVLIHSESQLKMGAGAASEPFIWLESSVSNEEIVGAVIIAMSQSKTGVPNPTDWSAFSQEFLQKTGLKKQSDLYKGSLNVTALHKDGVISFTPMINNGSKGFVNVPNAKITVPDDESMNALAVALEVAFSKSE